MASDLTAFGHALASERYRMRWTQARLARALEELGHTVTGSAIGAWERGENAPTRDKVFALEQALGCSPGWLSRHLGYLPPSDGDSDERSITPQDPQVELLHAVRSLQAAVDRLADRLPPPARRGDGRTS